jgi:hypothetical protein
MKGEETLEKLRKKQEARIDPVVFYVSKLIELYPSAWDLRKI